MHDRIFQLLGAPDRRGALSSCRCCEGDGVSSSTFSFRSLVCAIKFFSQVRFSVCRPATKFPSGVTSSLSAVSRNLCANCMSWLGAPPCITVFSKWKSSSLYNGPSLAIASCRICSAIVNELIHTQARFVAEKARFQPGTGPRLSEIPSKPGTPFAPVEAFRAPKTVPRKVHPRNLSVS